MITLPYTAADLRHPLESHRQRFRWEPEGPCEGVHCVPLPAPRSDQEFEVAARLTDRLLEQGYQLDGAVGTVAVRLLEEQPFGLPRDLYHAHLVVWGEDPAAGPRWYSLEGVPRRRRPSSS